MGNSDKKYSEEILNTSPENHSQASELLEQALMQMDGIISGNGSVQGNEFAGDSDLIQDLSHKLKIALETSITVKPPEPDVQSVLLGWLQMKRDNKECMASIDRRQNHSELEIQVLTQQIEAQNQKILDLKTMLEEKQQLLNELSYKLQQEIKGNSGQFIKAFYQSLPCQQQCLNTNFSLVIQSPEEAYRESITEVEPEPMSHYFSLRTRGQSVPNLENEKLYLEDYKIQSKKLSSLWKILSHLKHSSSGKFNDVQDITVFNRGGIRATTGGRLGWSEPHLSEQSGKIFTEWNIDDFCQWVKKLGLEEYITDLKKLLKADQKIHQNLFTIETNLPIKNTLHKKKFFYALMDIQNNYKNDPYLHQAGKLDMSWVLRWLDDIGLPQYKEFFINNKIDGRVLHRLTVDDMALLNMTSLLHVTSLKRGIQVLRENNFNPNCLLRRAQLEGAIHPKSREISLWTTHRLMEWLKSVDLAEYAPNLRGAGVHGGLIVYETRFTADLLATLLSIPPGKTLLRRHLNMHFKELLGNDIINQKREAASKIGSIPLTPSSKFKVHKKNQFSLKRKCNKNNSDFSDLLYPMNPLNVSDEEDMQVLNIGCLS